MIDLNPVMSFDRDPDLDLDLLDVNPQVIQWDPGLHPFGIFIGFKIHM